MLARGLRHRIHVYERASADWKPIYRRRPERTLVMLARSLQRRIDVDGRVQQARCQAVPPAPRHMVRQHACHVRHTAQYAGHKFACMQSVYGARQEVALDVAAIICGAGVCSKVKCVRPHAQWQVSVRVVLTALARAAHVLSCEARMLIFERSSMIQLPFVVVVSTNMSMSGAQAKQIMSG